LTRNLEENLLENLDWLDVMESIDSFDTPHIKSDGRKNHVEENQYIL